VQLIDCISNSQVFSPISYDKLIHKYIICDKMELTDNNCVEIKHMLNELGFVSSILQYKKLNDHD